MDENSQNDKIAFFGTKKGELRTRKLPSWEGFEYYKTTKDVNGISFNYEHLSKFPEKYVISVLRQVDKKTCLYNYFVENKDLKRFFQSCFDGKIEGEIIEIEKCKPETLA